jgi:hypothetical protein
MDQGKFFEIIITRPAILRYQDEVLTYLQRNYSAERASKIDEEIMDQVVSLQSNPHRGGIENFLKQGPKIYRYILFKGTRHFELKIVYFVNDQFDQVFVTDFFPTKMHPDRIKS